MFDIRIRSTETCLCADCRFNDAEEAQAAYDYPVVILGYSDDLIVWPDGTIAEREDVLRGDYNWKSDDYEVVAHGTDRWFELAL